MLASHPRTGDSLAGATPADQPEGHGGVPLRARLAKRHQTFDRAEELGLAQGLGAGPLTGWRPEATAASVEAFETMYTAWRRRARESGVDSTGRLSAALSWWERFLLAFPGMPPFQQLRFEGDLERERVNAKLLGSFQEFMRRSGSLRAGKHTANKSDTIGGYASEIATLLGLEDGFAVLNSRRDMIGARARKQMRWEDGPTGDRELERGLRAAHLDALQRSPDFDTTSDEGRWRYGVMRFAHNAIARGGDPGVVGTEEPLQERDIMMSDFYWREPRRAADGAMYRSLTVSMLPTKDAARRQKRHPVEIRRRRPESDPRIDACCTYDTLHQLFAEKMAQAPLTCLMCEGPRSCWGQAAAGASVSHRYPRRGLVAPHTLLLACGSGREGGWCGPRTWPRRPRRQHRLWACRRRTSERSLSAQAAPQTCTTGWVQQAPRPCSRSAAVGART